MFGRRTLATLLTVTTVLWSIGISLLVPQAALAAITVSGPFELIPGGGMHAPANSFDLPLVRVGLTQSASESLSSIAVTILNNTSGAVTNNTLADHIAKLVVFKDSNGNNVFDPGVDGFAGQISPVKVATSTNVINTGSNNSIGASGGLATSFFVMAQTAGGWGGSDAFKVSMATDGIVTSANSPVLGSAFTTGNAVDALVPPFGIQKVTLVDSKTVDIIFTDFLDLGSGQATSTANYALSGTGNAAVSSVMLLPDNRSVRVNSGGANLVDSGASFIAVNANVKSGQGTANSMTGATPIFSGFQPLVISEVKAGSGAGSYDEFIEIYNRGGAPVGTSTVKIHLLNAAGTVDTNLALTFVTGTIPSHGFFLVAPTGTAPGGVTPDATYVTSSVSIVLDGAAYLSNSAASSTAVGDRVCWGTHSVPSDCEGASAAALANDGKSIERKANNTSSAATMSSGGADETNGNAQDSQNNSFDFVVRGVAQPQNSLSAPENPGGGSQGGAGNMAPMIQHTSIFQATTGTAFTIIARMTDDGGQLTSNNTQLIYCVTDASCTPASSTPIFGTSIGSGWFKFVTSSVDWSANTKTKFKYYLQAKDSASPAKVRVFTNDPSFDTTEANVNPGGAQVGIQTAALQESKALTVNVLSSNLGTASIAGKIVDTNSNGIGGATVWIDGSQYAVTTGNDGGFSFTNVGPSGGKQIRVAKDGYADQQSSIFIPPSGLVTLPNITLYSGNMGQGGDFNSPKVINSNPAPNSNGFPTQGPGGVGAPSIVLNFSKAMDTTTYVTSTGGSVASNIYLTEAGSNIRIAGAVTASNNMQATFTPTAALTVGKGYTLFVTPGVKDSAGNPVTGNGPGGQYVLMFSTASQFFSGNGDFGGAGAVFGMGNAFPPFVKGSMPAPGAVGVSRSAHIFVSFSEAMQNTTANKANVVLYSVANPFTASESKVALSAVNSFDNSGKIMIITPGSTLSASTHYRVEVLGGITSSKGVPLGNPGQVGFATTVFYKGDFDTGTTSDVTAPSVIATIPASAASGVSTVNPIVVNFSEAMDPSTITDSSISVKLGSNAVDGTLTFDFNSWTAKFASTYALSPTSTYTISVSTDVKDLSGNSLATALLRTFTTGSADTSAPTVVSAQGNDFAMKVAFSKPMLAVPAGDLNYTNSVLNPANYVVRRVNSAGVQQGAVVPLGSATFNYDAPNRSVAINGLSFGAGIFTAGTTLLNVVASSVKDIGFNDVASGANAATTTGQSSAMSGGFGSGGGSFQDASGNNIQGGQFGPPPNEFASFKSSGIGFIPSVKVFPFNSMAGVSTIYGIDAPISQQIPTGGFIDITFPEGTDVSQAIPDPNSPKNGDINGPGTGTVVFGTNEGTLPSGWTTGGASSDGLIVNTSARTVRMILGAVATRSENSDTHDFLHFDVAQITNSASVAGAGTAGNTATVETKKADGTVIESLTSGSFFTTQSGNLTVRGRLLAGVTGLNGAKVFLMAPMTGRQSTTTANSVFGVQDGEFMFQNLGAGVYMLGVDQYFKAGGTSYTASFPIPVNVNTTDCVSNICTSNIAVTDAATGAAVTLSISGTFNNDAVDIFAGGPGTFRMATTTLNGVLTNNTANSIKLNANGKWFVGFGPSMKGGLFNNSGPATPAAWTVPKPQEVQVTGCPGACAVTPSTVTFSSAKADNAVKFTVKDASGNKLGQAFVTAYSPSGGVSMGAAANADGTGSLSMATGTYKMSAGLPGMPPGVEKSINVTGGKVYVDGSTSGITLSTMSASDLVLTVSKPSYSISGKVTDGSNPVSNAPVSAFRNDGQGHADTFTNSSGDYTLYVSNGTWRVSAFLPQQYGKLPEKSITVSGASVSGQNFEPNTSAITYATVTKNVGTDTDGSGAIGSGEGLSNVQVTVIGTTGDLNNDGDTTDSGENLPYINSVLTDANGSSTLKVPPGTYTLKSWSPTIGELPQSTASSTLVVSGSGTVTTAPTDVVAPVTGTVTVNVLDTYGNATTTDKMVIEFQQIGGKNDNVGVLTNVSSTAFTLPTYDAGSNTVALNSVTSTNPANFYLMKITNPGIAAGSINVSGGGSTTMATSTVASGLYKVEIDGNETINVRLPDISYVNGTVKDENGAAVPDAVVHIENKTTGETEEVKADSSGNYVAKLSSGTYLVQGEKDGYLDTASTVSVTASGTIAAAATTMTTANRVIIGTVTAGGSAIVGAQVKGQQLGGDTVAATTGSDGTYTLNVTSGDWKVSATADGYSEKSYSNVVSVSGSNVSGITIALSGTNTSLAAATSLSVTPQTGGSLDDSAANVSIKAPGSAISSSANSFSLSEKETSNVVGSGSGKPIGGEAKEVTSYNGSDSSLVTTLSNNVSVSASYSTSELASSLGTLSIAKLEQVKMGSFDSTSDNWEHLPTTVAYKDSSGNFVEPSSNLSNVASVSYTGQTLHLSVFNPIQGSDGLAPAAPTGVTATAGSGSVTITWIAPSTNSDSSALSDLLGYEVYRSTSVNGTYTQINNSDIVGTSYTDSSASNGTTYYYKVTAADTGGLESALSSASSGATPSASSSSSGGGGGAQPTTGIRDPLLGSPSVVVTNAIAGAVASRLLTLTLNVINATQVMISENATFSGAQWDTYGASKQFVLSAGNGQKNLYVKFRSAYGTESASVLIPLTMNAPENEVLPTLTSVAPTPIAAVSSKATPSQMQSSSAIRLTAPPKVNYQPGEKLAFTYQYVNAGKKTVTVKIVRQLVNAKGKALTSTTVTKTLKAKVVFDGKVDEAVGAKLSPGDYVVKIKILDAKNKVLDENSFPITVEKLKKKVFKLGAVAAADSAISFEEKNFSKVPRTGGLPVILKLTYTYSNTDSAPHKVKMVRELLDSVGKVIATKTGKWAMKVGEHDSQTFTQPVTPAWDAGNYSIRLRAYDAVSGDVLAENSLGFSIESE